MLEPKELSAMSPIKDKMPARRLLAPSLILTGGDIDRLYLAPVIRAAKQLYNGLGA
jgi:hypothetical protein